MLKMSDGYPYGELVDVGEHLRLKDVLVPDYPDPGQNVCVPDTHLFAWHAEGVQTVLLPDLNVISAMTKAAKGLTLDDEGRNVAAVLSFAQFLDIQIEPSIAFHEMAFNQGNEVALEKLGWFVGANNGDAFGWLAAARGDIDRIRNVGALPATNPRDLAKPLGRWRRNYVVAMKIGELELNPDLNAVQRVSTLLTWMRDDFILAGPAAMLAVLYFAPMSPPRKGLLKNLRSPNREAALAGAKNAAWDLTYISEFARRINEGSDHDNRRYILATFDKRLRDIARFVVGEHEELGAHDSLAQSLERWWPKDIAEQIAELWKTCWTRVRPHGWWDQYQGRDYVGELIEKGETALLNWQPPKA